MKILNPRRFKAGESLQPDAYLMPEFQDSFGIANSQIDSRNIENRVLTTRVFAADAFTTISHLTLDSLSSILVASAVDSFDSFNCSATIDTPEGFLTGSITLSYLINTVLEPTDTAVINTGYVQTAFGSTIAHQFALFLDGIVIGQTDNLGEGSYNTCHIPFSTPIEAGTHVLELKVRLPIGRPNNGQTTLFNPSDYAYAWYQVRRR